MPAGRRAFLATCLAAAAGRAVGAPAIATPWPALKPKSARQRVVIVGGGWGGLAAARHLRELAPDLDVVVIERNASFWSGPLSNRWLAGLVDTRYIVLTARRRPPGTATTWSRPK
ncbi:MAG: FAD-dependent oxidoreductase [Rhodocyclaceae bacterium]|nr:FAD-dependent oxidoreductase [Rhodocyclaceae bacterium]